MTETLETVLDKVSAIPNPVNSSLIQEFYQFIVDNHKSDVYKKNNLKALILFQSWTCSKYHLLRYSEERKDTWISKQENQAKIQKGKAALMLEYALRRSMRVLSYSGLECTRCEEVDNCARINCESAAVWWASALLISKDSQFVKQFWPYAPTYAMHVLRNVKGTMLTTASNALKHG